MIKKKVDMLAILRESFDIRVSSKILVVNHVKMKIIGSTYKTSKPVSHLLIRGVGIVGLT